jgi:hypothetical protein
LRSAMHQAGASALTQLLRYDPPDADHRTIPCPCGHSAHYKELRSKTPRPCSPSWGRSNSPAPISCAPIAPKDSNPAVPGGR